MSKGERMTKTTDKHRGNTGNLRPWKPGQSGNPKGRPKGIRYLSELVRDNWDRFPREEAKEAKKEKRAARTYEELMAEAWMQKFLEGNATAMTQLLK